MAGLAFGRIGCFLNGCCYGGETDRPWAVTFPKYASRYEETKPPILRRYSPPYSDQASSGELYGLRLESRADQPAVVTQVAAGSAAEAAGLKVGDAIVAINRAPVASLSDARARIFQNLVSGATLSLSLGDGHEATLPPIALPPRSRPVHPAQLYSAIEAGLLSWLLWSYYPFRRRDGEVMALLLTVHPISRFMLEIIRVDEPAVFDTGLSISQNISIGLLVCAAALWWFLSKQPQGTVWARAA
jgi:phosphatidylglycerol:prolipoprotein diacylglycerol transferase